jgi:hypothetical protein
MNGPAAATRQRLRALYLAHYGVAWPCEDKLFQQLNYEAWERLGIMSDSAKKMHARRRWKIPEIRQEIFKGMRREHLKIIARDRESTRLVAMDLDRRKALMTVEEAKFAEDNAEALHGKNWRAALVGGE